MFRLTRSFSFVSRYKSLADPPQFTVTHHSGFLPRQHPLTCLPSNYEHLEKLLQAMPVTKADGTPGLLHEGLLEKEITKLPHYNIDPINDSRLLAALFRDYTFLASAYLLEPCDVSYRKTGKYGIGRSVLPKNIAVPLVQVAQKMEAKPFMEYALTYALYNYRMIEQKRGLHYDNLQLIRTLAGSKDEHGFVLVHVAMAAHTSELVMFADAVLSAAKSRDRVAFNYALIAFKNTMQTINDVMETMWARSDPKGYMGLRTFIMGIKNQPMFPNGVLYQGVSTEPHFYRGESGANDSIIPTADNLFEVTNRLPVNPLTEILKDFRSYRPIDHQDYLKCVETEAKNAKVREFAEKDSTTAVLYLMNLDQIRQFRFRHWNFTKEYIIKRTEHPVATGGSPIVTWLPNQLMTVMDLMLETESKIKRSDLSVGLQLTLDEIVKRADTQRKVVRKDVENLKK